MSLSKKGTRKIKIDDKVFLWRVSTRQDHLRLTIQPEKGSLLIFTIPFTDAWLRLGMRPEEKENLIDNEIEVVKPSFVKRAIEFALSQDWMDQNKNQPYRLTFTDGKFRRINKTNIG